MLQCQGGGSVYSLAVTNQHIICGTYENKINVRARVEDSNSITLHCSGDSTLLGWSNSDCWCC